MLNLVTKRAAAALLGAMIGVTMAFCSVAKADFQITQCDGDCADASSNCCKDKYNNHAQCVGCCTHTFSPDPIPRCQQPAKEQACLSACPP